MWANAGLSPPKGIRMKPPVGGRRRRSRGDRLGPSRDQRRIAGSARRRRVRAAVAVGLRSSRETLRGHLYHRVDRGRAEAAMNGSPEIRRPRSTNVRDDATARGGWPDHRRCGAHAQPEAFARLVDRQSRRPCRATGPRHRRPRRRPRGRSIACTPRRRISTSLVRRRRGRRRGRRPRQRQRCATGPRCRPRRVPRSSHHRPARQPTHGAPPAIAAAHRLTLVSTVWDSCDSP